MPIYSSQDDFVYFLSGQYFPQITQLTQPPNNKSSPHLPTLTKNLKNRHNAAIMSDPNNNILLNPKTKNFPDGTMASLRAELGLMAGFIGAFILAFAVWCILFKYFNDKEDKKRAETMARGVEMRGGVRRREGRVGLTGMAVQDGEGDGLSREQRMEESGSGSKGD